MNDRTCITYLFDPLCGWCYGASPVIEKLFALPDYSVELAPTGLFAGKGARAMDANFAAFAWANDQRIHSATGQPFSDAYRQKVLNGSKQAFDSGPATLALTAAAITAPARELEALGAIQKLRYVAGGNNTDLEALSRLFHELNLHDAADLLTAPDDALIATTQRRMEAGRDHMRQFNATGVPTLIVSSGQKRRLVRAEALFESIEAVLVELRPT